MADRKISDLTALTTPAAGDYLPIVDISEAAAASKNKRITIEELFRGVPLGTAAAPSIAIEGDEDTGVFSPGANQLAVATNGTGRLFINSTGLVGIGTSAPINTVSVELAFGSFKGYSLQSSGAHRALFGANSGTGEIRIGSASIGWQPTFYSNNAEAMRIDLSGRVGIGTTSPGSTLDVQAASARSKLVSTTGTNAAYHTFINTGGNFYIGLDNSAGGDFSAPYAGAIWHGGAYPLIFGTSNAERARIDSSGRLLVGTSTSGDISAPLQVVTSGGYAFSSFSNRDDGYGPELHLSLSRGTFASPTIVSSGDQPGRITFRGYSGSAYVESAQIKAEIDGTPGAGDMPGRLVFSTTADGASSPTERMRINSAGTTTLTSASVTSATLIVKSNGASDFQRGIVINFDGRTPNDNQSYFWSASDTTNTKGAFYSNGGLANYSANNVNLCDEREKKNIEAIESTWSRLKNWELKKFHYNEDDDADDKRYGVIAQQVALHCPEVISDWVKQRAQDAVLDDDGNIVTPAKEEIVRIGVKEQQMYWMAIKALQEAQIRIETLEAEVAALKAQ